MTQEEKELLLRDLCARLPYGVKYDCMYGSYKGTQELTLIELYDIIDNDWIDGVNVYLRPMSSMTEDEKDELRQEHIKDEKLFTECITKAANGDSSMRGKVVPHFAVDWCNKNHFDYRSLIELGLALEAPEGMYNLNNE